LPRGIAMQVLEMIAAKRGDEDVCGADLLKDDATLPMGKVYSALHDLEASGLITSRVEKRPGVRGLGVRLVCITDDGKQAVKLMARLRAAEFWV
jgi:DNA-binding PadR family transcriptional regulator